MHSMDTISEISELPLGMGDIIPSFLQWASYNLAHSIYLYISIYIDIEEGYLCLFWPFLGLFVFPV